ncbi:MAG: hypothetical protein JWN83_2666 [Chitinophagaceae bacterium]|nr:hypothetical protein [Chitinophagaceae bacterium]
MSKIFLSALLLLLLYGCSRRHTPARTDSVTVTTLPGTATKSDSVVVKKTNFTPRKKDIIPPSIVVNDKAAKKAVDGRLYYDLLGHRYWKNYKDGKYYLFNQKMYDNPAFSPPK